MGCKECVVGKLTTDPFWLSEFNKRTLEGEEGLIVIKKGQVNLE